VASAAYRSGEKLHNNETGLTHDFTRKGGVVMSEILLPENAPDRYLIRETLWNEVQQVEKRSDAQLAREVEVALPKEIDREEQIECVRGFIKDNFCQNSFGEKCLLLLSILIALLGHKFSINNLNSSVKQFFFANLYFFITSFT
jgi:hypothetical protein